VNKNEKKMLKAALRQLDGCDGCTKSTHYFYHEDDPRIPKDKALAVTTEFIEEHLVEKH